MQMSRSLLHRLGVTSAIAALAAVALATSVYLPDLLGQAVDGNASDQGYCCTEAKKTCGADRNALITRGKCTDPKAKGGMGGKFVKGKTQAEWESCSYTTCGAEGYCCRPDDDPSTDKTCAEPKVSKADCERV